MIPVLTEIKDGLLASSDKELMKARDVELFPPLIKSYYENIEKIHQIIIAPGERTVTVVSSDKQAVFDSDLFEYVHDLHPVNYYLSNVPLPGEGEFYTLFAEYAYGVCAIAPMGV